MSRVALTLRKSSLCLLHKGLRGPQGLSVQFTAPRELNLGRQSLSLFIIPSGLIASFFLPPIAKEVTVHEIKFGGLLFSLCGQVWSTTVVLTRSETTLLKHECLNPSH